MASNHEGPALYRADRFFRLPTQSAPAKSSAFLAFKAPAVRVRATRVVLGVTVLVMGSLRRCAATSGEEIRCRSGDVSRGE